MFCSLLLLSTRHGILFIQFLSFATLQMSPNRGSQILEPVKYLNVVTSENKTNKRKGSQSENKRAGLQGPANSQKHKDDSVAGVTPWHTVSGQTERLSAKGQSTNGYSVCRLQLRCSFSNTYIYLK